MNPVEIEEDIRALELMLGGVHRQGSMGMPGLHPGTHVSAVRCSTEEPEVVVERRVIGEDGQMKIVGPGYVEKPYQ